MLSLHVKHITGSHGIIRCSAIACHIWVQRSRKIIHCTVSAFEGCLWSQHCHWIAFLFVPLQSWKPGVVLALGFRQPLQPQELQACFAVALFPSLQCLEPLALYALQDSRIQTAQKPLMALALNALKQFWCFEPKPGTSGFVASVPKNPSAGTCPLSASNLLLDAYPNPWLTPCCGTTLQSVKTTSVPARH